MYSEKNKEPEKLITTKKERIDSMKVRLNNLQVDILKEKEATTPLTYLEKQIYLSHLEEVYSELNEISTMIEKNEDILGSFSTSVNELKNTITILNSEVTRLQKKLDDIDSSRKKERNATTAITITLFALVTFLVLITVLVVN